MLFSIHSLHLVVKGGLHYLHIPAYTAGIVSFHICLWDIFFLAFLVYKQQPTTPVFGSIYVGCVSCTVQRCIANIYFKISMHAIALGGCWVCFGNCPQQSMLMTWPWPALFLSRASVHCPPVGERSTQRNLQTVWLGLVCYRNSLPLM